MAQLDLSNPAVAPSGASGFNLILAPGVLQAGTAYIFRLSVVTSQPDGVGQGQVTVLASSVRSMPIGRMRHARLTAVLVCGVGSLLNRGCPQSHRAQAL